MIAQRVIHLHIAASVSRPWTLYELFRELGQEKHLRTRRGACLIRPPEPTGFPAGMARSRVEDRMEASTSRPNHPPARAATMKRPRLRFVLSLRVLLALVLVLGLGLGWWVDSARRQALAVAEVQKYGGYTKYDFEYKDGTFVDSGKSWVPGWLRKPLGDDYFHRVVMVAYMGEGPIDAKLAPLKVLDGVEALCWFNGPMCGTGMESRPAPILPPPGMEKLTEKGLERLAGLSRLRRLEVDRGEGGEIPGFAAPSSLPFSPPGNNQADEHRHP